MPHRLFLEWMAFDRLEPTGYAIENFRAGQICSTIANAAGCKTNPSDFFPRRKTQKTPQQILNLLQAVFPKGD